MYENELTGGMSRCLFQTSVIASCLSEKVALFIRVACVTCSLCLPGMMFRHPVIRWEWKCLKKKFKKKVLQLGAEAGALSNIGFVLPRLTAS